MGYLLFVRGGRDGPIIVPIGADTEKEQLGGSVVAGCERS